MLVLSRRVDEAITIAPPGAMPVTVIVVGIRGDKVRLGFRVGDDVDVYRAELDTPDNPWWPRKVDKPHIKPLD